MLLNRKIISKEKLMDEYALVRYECENECFSCVIDKDGNELYSEPFNRESDMISEFQKVQYADEKHHPKAFLLKQNLYNAVCRLMDYSTYYVTTMDINDRLNETEQYFDFGHYVSDEVEDFKNTDIVKAETYLNDSEKALMKLVDDARTKCKDMFEEVFSRDEETQKLILGKVYEYNSDEMEELLDYVICKEHPYYSEEAYADFMEEFDNSFPVKGE